MSAVGSESKLVTRMIFRMVLEWTTVDEFSHPSKDSAITVASALVCVCVVAAAV